MNNHQKSKAIALRFLLAMVLAVVSIHAIAQVVPASRDSDNDPRIALQNPQSKEIVREMVSRLNDDDVRALLIERLDAVAEANNQSRDEDLGVLGVLGLGFSRYWEQAKDSVLATGDVPHILRTYGERIQSETEPGGIDYLLMIVALAIAVGVAMERLVAFLFRNMKQRLIDKTSKTLGGILKIIYGRLSFDVLGVLAFWLAGVLILHGEYPGGSIAFLVGYIPIGAIAAGWMGYVVSRFFFAPKRPDLRICKTSDRRAMQLTVSFSLLTAYVVLCHNLFYAFIVIGETHLGGWEFGPVGFYINLSIYIAAALTVIYNRAALTEVLVENKKRVFQAIGEESIDEVSWFARHWPAIAIVLIVLKYLMVEIVVNSTDVGVYSTAAVYITFVVIFLWPGVDANISLFVGRGIRPAEDESEAAGRARRTMQQGLLRVGRVVVVGAVLYALARLWGLNVLDLAEAELGAQAAGTLIEFLFVVLLAYLAWELVSIFTEHWLAAEGGAPGGQDEEAGGEIGGVGLSRVATLLPIIRKAAQFVIVLVSVIMVLDNWGVNIGPILAGAGVVGLAIGFGAQTLVKDIVSGLFFLADDAFRVGEYIDVGGTMGNVEKISLRSLRLRHHRGLVHTIPYGEIPKLTNFSRDWVIMKLRFRVPFETDINQVKKIFKQIGADLLEHPELGPDFLQPFKSQGVAEVDDNGMVVRGKFMAKPGKQFMIRKEVYVRVQKAFEEAGIPFARKQVMVHIPGLSNADDLSPDDIRQIGAAAAEAAEEPLPEEQDQEQPRKP